ncbi:MAG: hypothetical protein R2795_23615 [Saprospiraceae bacterium]
MHRYYRMRYPHEDGQWEYTPLASKDTLATTTARVAPWVSLQGKAQPIHLIFIDNELAYYNIAWQQTPYSIVTEPGYQPHSVATHRPRNRFR